MEKALFYLVARQSLFILQIEIKKALRELTRQWQGRAAAMRLPTKTFGTRERCMKREPRRGISARLLTWKPWSRRRRTSF